MDDPRSFLVHDINFHRAVAAASGNPIVASLVEMVSALYYERRRETAARASDRDLRDAAEMHRRIYQAIRARDAEARDARCTSTCAGQRAPGAGSRRGETPAATRASPQRRGSARRRAAARHLH